jgi:hypothetical protein
MNPEAAVVPFRSLGRTRSKKRRVVAAAPPEPKLTDLFAANRWVPKGRIDPELRKALGVIQVRLSETRRLLAAERPGESLEDDPCGQELKSLLGPDPAKLDIDAAWELSGAIRRLNVRFRNREFLASRLEYERARSKKAGQWHSWDKHFALEELDQLIKLFKQHGRQINAGALDRVVDRLTFLYLQREEAGRDRRARAAVKRHYLTRLGLVLVVLLAGFGVAFNVATQWHGWEAVVLTVCAGALGSALSGIFKVRDQLVQLEELRGFWPAMRVQPLIGACGGLILLLVLQSHAVSVGNVSDGFAGWALLAFAAGFSEPFFLGIVQRVAVVPDRPQAEEAEPKTADLADSAAA